MSTTVETDRVEERTPACTLTDLGVDIASSQIDIVDDIDLQIYPGEVVGLVGESGSGKTTVGTSLLGYARTGAVITEGHIDVVGEDIRRLSIPEVRKVRGVKVAYVPQDPASALNPSIRLGDQLRETLDLRNIYEPGERDGRIRDILTEVGLPNDDEFLRRFPHQISGGQVQRVALAMVFLPRPQVLVLDEPTTGLDVTTQGMVLNTMAALCEEYDVAALYVTHDLAVVANVADRVAVMYAGQIVEIGPTQDIFNNPSHPYTRALLDAIPHLHHPKALSGIPGRTPGPGRRPNGCRFNDRCELAIPACEAAEPDIVQVSPEHGSRCIRIEDLEPWDSSRSIVNDTDPDKGREIVLSVQNLNVFYGQRQVVHDVSFDLAKGEVVALVGESGSGKTTISHCVGGLHKNWTGGIYLDDEELSSGARSRTWEQRQRIQYVFQNPYQSLNPRRTVEQIIRRPLQLFGIAKGSADARKQAEELLEAVALGPTVLPLRTNRLSGGERQRVAIARALAARPEVLVCDEITSALDVSIQGSIIALLERLRQTRGISMLFVTHDLALVRSIADRVLVLNQGRLVEHGWTAEVLEHPQEEYTKTLIANTPTL